ncbi:hypothetical protein H4R34_002032 [Dimargaris verticillata]|uniref:Major facilitator superfamily domain-containing protein n=1 Tax=Dimargaris verticillata TaxID=2761393 RepID=A0A9W8E9P8_9FUNG|nr:hypothetical protein H4R34_002032 [Dimargaris verticillata]
MKLSLYHSQTQVWVMSLVFFFTAGSYYTLTGMGGGGLDASDSSVSSNANTALYVSAAVMGLAAGSVNNVLGPRLSCLIGGVTVGLYIASLMSYSIIHSSAVVIVAGAIMGLGQALLSTAGGAVTSGYPSPAKKGQAAAIYLCLFNLSGVIGGVIPFITHFSEVHSANGSAIADSVEASKSSSIATFMAFLGLVGFGCLTSLLLMPPGRLIRDDGFPVTICKPEHGKPSKGLQALVHEVTGIRSILKLPKTWVAAPMFLSITCYYAYQFNGFNLELFNARTRGLNNVCYRLFAIGTSVAVGRFMDSNRLSKLRRLQCIVAVLAVINVATWLGALFVQRAFKSGSDGYRNIDVTDPTYRYLWLIFSGWGVLDASLNVLGLWIVACLSSDATESSRYAGFLAAMQFLSSAIYWQMDAQKLNNYIFLALTFAIIMVGLTSAFATGFWIKAQDDLQLKEKQLDTASQESSLTFEDTSSL